MANIITIDYKGKKLRLDLATMKAVDESDIPTDFHPRVSIFPPKLAQQVWMGKNLDFDDGEGGIIRNPDHPEYGCYYTWEAAMRVAEKIPGWHLPTQLEWDMLCVAAGGSDIACKTLKADHGWPDDANGEDSMGFAALPAGYFGGSFYSVGSRADFWTATDGSSNSAYYRYFDTGAQMYSRSNYKDCQYSVRLVQDS